MTASCKSGAIAPLPTAWTAAGGGGKFSLTKQADNKKQTLSSLLLVAPPQDQLAVAREVSHQPGTLFLVPKYGQQNDGPKYAHILIPGACAYVILYRKGDSADVIKVRTSKGEIIILKYTGGIEVRRLLAAQCYKLPAPGKKLSSAYHLSSSLSLGIQGVIAAIAISIILSSGSRVVMRCIASPGAESMRVNRLSLLPARRMHS